MKTDEKLALIWHTRRMRNALCIFRIVFCIFKPDRARDINEQLHCICRCICVCGRVHTHTQQGALHMQADPNPLAVSFTCFRQTHTTHNTAYTLHYSAVMKAVSPCRTAVSA